VIVEVTFDKNVTAKFAKSVVQYALDTTDSRWFHPERTSVIKMKAKEAERVIQAEIRQRRRVASQVQARD
jgi:hypothetical protein